MNTNDVYIQYTVDENDDNLVFATVNATVTFIFIERQARVVSTMCVMGCSHELNGLAVISL